MHCTTWAVFVKCSSQGASRAMYTVFDASFITEQRGFGGLRWMVQSTVRMVEVDREAWSGVCCALRADRRAKSSGAQGHFRALGDA